MPQPLDPDPRLRDPTDVGPLDPPDFDDDFGEGGPSARLDLEHQGLSRSEYIAAMVHFYRGEMYRATAWRLRLDNTTNWSIISTAGLLTFSFGHPESTPLVLLLGQGLVFAFLWIESRRFRFFDVWRSRVRKIEENFYNPILTRRLVSPDPLWGDAVAHDLSAPRFKMSRWHALHQRLRASYLFLFAILNLAWISKLFIHPFPSRDPAIVLDRLEMGLVPWWVTMTTVFSFWALLIVIWMIPGESTTIRGRKWGLEDEDVGEDDR